MGFCGNSDIQVWERGNRREIRREVLRKLNAARGGGFIFQSDHSVSSPFREAPTITLFSSSESTAAIPCNSASSTNPVEVPVGETIVQRFGQVIGIEPDKIAEYRRLHASG